MEIKVATENGRVPITVLHVDGNIDSATSAEFQKKAEQLIKDGARYFLIDLSHVPYVSSAGLRVLHAIFNQLRSLNPDSNLSDEAVKQGINAGTYTSPHLKLLNLSPQNRKVLEMSGFDMFIETLNDRKAAIASF